MSIQYSDEIINAFVDGELDGAEKDDFKKALAENKQLADTVNRLCELKQSVQIAYSSVPESSISEKSGLVQKYKNFCRYGYAAILFLTLGTFAGWFSNQYFDNGLLPSSGETLNGVKLTNINFQQPNKIILHIGSSKPDKFKETINKIESILKQYDKNQLPFELEIIANSGGIDLLRKDTSPYKDKIESIMSSNNNVSFIACTNTLEKLKKLGVKTDLIARTKSNTTAVDKIVSRLQQGWIYVKV